MLILLLNRQINSRPEKTCGPVNTTGKILKAVSDRVTCFDAGRESTLKEFLQTLNTIHRNFLELFDPVTNQIVIGHGRRKSEVCIRAMTLNLSSKMRQFL